jgi:hypothetical protein
VLYRSLPDLNPPAEADLDTPEMVEALTVLALAQQHQRVLARMVEMGMELLELNAENAKKDLASRSAANDAFCKITQAVRRTVALQAKLAGDAKMDRDGLQAERTRRRDDAAKAHKETKELEIALALDDAYAASCSDEQYAESEELLDRFLLDGEELLEDADEFRGYLDRPVGETVAKLCAAIGLDPNSCILDGETWKVRRPPSELELTCEELRSKGAAPAIDPMSTPPPCHAATGPP